MSKTRLQTTLKQLVVLTALGAASILATGCFGGSFAFAVMPSEGAKRVSCAPGQVHVKGYWEYQGGDYVWVMGRCVQPKSGCKWIAGRYKVKRRGNVKVKTWKPGHWKCGNQAKVVVKPKPKKTVVVVKPKPKPKKTVVVVKPKPKKKVVVVKPKQNKKVVVVKPRQKPQPKIIVVNPPPPKNKPRKATKGKIWIPGHYAWNGSTNSYKWINGRFKKKKPGKRWVAGRYKVETRGNYKVKIWVPGSWR